MEQKPHLPGLLFHAIHRAHHNAVHSRLAEHGQEGVGSPMLLMVLRRQKRGDTLPTQRELADALHISPAAVAMSLKTLERLGYVEKRSDRSDQRCKRIAVTERGAAAVRACWEVFREVDREMLEGFTVEEREQLDGYHRRMLQNLYGGPEELENPFAEALNEPCGCRKEGYQC